MNGNYNIRLPIHDATISVAKTALAFISSKIGLTSLTSKEETSPLSAAIANQTITPPLNPYRPNVFTINGYDYPLNQNDSLGMVEAQVGDTIFICVVNAGNMPHAMHFHGFHYQILFSLKQPERQSWIKDSGPIFREDAMILRVVPDKPGAYPVHDHNLTANTSNGGYPGGMMTMLMIDP